MTISRRGFIRGGAFAAVCAAAPVKAFGQRAGSTMPAASAEGGGEENFFPVPFRATTSRLYYMDKTTFAPYLNTEFGVSAPDAAPQKLTLVEVADLERDAEKAENPRRGRKGFSLLFTGAREQLLDQREYRVAH